MLIGPAWLMFLGIALVALSEFVSQRKSSDQRKYGFGLLGRFAAYILLSLFLDFRAGEAFTQKPNPFWFWIFIGVIWFWGVVSEVGRWRRSRILTDA
jgi:hypothetical protein